ncbi:hypothetical protein [Streptomyces sp. NPDC088923]|uniref:hypothetical protein n=1 Tax=Streptomyces sp. NPDC088923 TaxID=3365913 RepID=UPI0038033A6F
MREHDGADPVGDPEPVEHEAHVRLHRPLAQPEPHRMPAFDSPPASRTRTSRSRGASRATAPRAPAARSRRRPPNPSSTCRVAQAGFAFFRAHHAHALAQPVHRVRRRRAQPRRRLAVPLRQVGHDLERAGTQREGSRFVGEPAEDDEEEEYGEERQPRGDRVLATPQHPRRPGENECRARRGGLPGAAAQAEEAGEGGQREPVVRGEERRTEGEAGGRGEQQGCRRPPRAEGGERERRETEPGGSPRHVFDKAEQARQAHGHGEHRPEPEGPDAVRKRGHSHARHGTGHH